MSIHYTASVVMANSYFWPEYPFKSNFRTFLQYRICTRLCLPSLKYCIRVSYFAQVCSLFINFHSTLSFVVARTFRIHNLALRFFNAEFVGYVYLFLLPMSTCSVWWFGRGRWCERRRGGGGGCQDNTYRKDVRRRSDNDDYDNYDTQD